MDLKIISAKEFKAVDPKGEKQQQEPVKLFVNKDNQLQFEDEAYNILRLYSYKGVKFASISEDQQELYMILCKELDNDCFALLNFTNILVIVGVEAFLNKFGYSYKNPSEKISFELIKENSFKDQEVYRMKEIVD